MPIAVDTWANQICAGDVRAIARAITAIEDHVARNPELVAKVGKVFVFKLTDPDSAWTIDLTTPPGTVTEGVTGKATCTLEMSDADFMAMATGQADAMKLFSSGKLKISGDVMASQKLGFLNAGRLVNGELSAHYASADVFLFPSTSETFGNVTLEAMASGLGIVAYRYAAARQHLEHGRSALLPPLDDEPAFIRDARMLVGDPKLARRLGAAARAAAESLTWERIAQDFEKVLLDVAA